MTVPDQYPAVLPQNKREAFLYEALSQADSPPNDDEVIGAFTVAAVNAYQSIPAYRELTDRYIEAEGVDNVSYQVNKFFKCHQALVIDDKIRYAISYPEKFDNPDAWGKLLESQLSDPNLPAYGKLERLLLEMPLQTNRHTRAKSIAFAATAQFLKQPLNYEPVVYDFGSSNNLVLKALATRMLDKTVVFDPDNQPNERLSVLFDLFTSMAPFGEGIGIEANPPQSSEELEFHKSCTLDPSQLDRDKGGQYEEVYDTLTELELGKTIGTVKTYFPELNRRTEKRLNAKKADIAFFSHSLCQNENAGEIIKKMMSFMNYRGLIIVQDYLEINPDRPQELKFLNHWYGRKWLCKTVVLDTKNPDEGFYPLFEWETAHCKNVKIMPGVHRLTDNFGT